MEKDEQSTVLDAVKKIEGAVDEITHTTERTLEPYRKSVFKRFPTLFILLVTFGVAAVFYGFELVMSDIPWLMEHPLVILFSGLAILVLTGTLYKKLG